MLAQTQPASPVTAQSIAAEAAVSSGIGGAVIGALGGLFFAKVVGEKDLTLWVLGGAACLGALSAAAAYEMTLDLNNLIAGVFTPAAPLTQQSPQTPTS